ncbi:MAG: hypothetical protein ACO1SV_21815 [Fimbriimonas sp.]
MIFVNVGNVPGGKKPFEPYKGLSLRWHMREFLAVVSAETRTVVTEEEVRSGKHDARIWPWLFPEAADADPEEALAYLEDPTIPFGASRVHLTICRQANGRSEIGYFDGFEEHDREWEMLQAHEDKHAAAIALLTIWKEMRS